jgi:hypothetical protein
MRDRSASLGGAPRVAPRAGPESGAGDRKQAIAFTTLRQCELCGGQRTHGKYLVTIPGQPSIWACDDCQKMLLLRVDDKGTPGD